MLEMDLLMEHDRMEAMAASRPEICDTTAGVGRRRAGADADAPIPPSTKKRRAKPRNLSSDERKRRVVEPKKRTYSSQKSVGARCYARWNSNEYFWGTITKIKLKGAKREYSVRVFVVGSGSGQPLSFVLPTFQYSHLQILFEDGDSLDGLYAHHIYTEKQYRVWKREEPPAPVLLASQDEDARADREHVLFGKGYCRKWTGVSGRTRTAYGKIGECFASFGDSEDKLFKVEYLNALPADEAEDEDPVAAHQNVSEQAAWGGYMLYVEEVDPLGLGAAKDLERMNSPITFRTKWLLPDTRRFDIHGRLVMEIRGFRLVFSVQDSSIPGAGLGLMLSAYDLTCQGRTHFALPLGELLCLGPYAPLRKMDRKTHHEFQVKDFIHSFAPGIYVFDANGRDHEVFDLTDDNTGELHELAAQKLLVRVNETDGSEVENVTAEHDPCGAVVYSLGRCVAGQDDLRFPVQTPCELKVSQLCNLL